MSFSCAADPADVWSIDRLTAFINLEVCHLSLTYIDTLRHFCQQLLQQQEECFSGCVQVDILIAFWRLLSNASPTMMSFIRFSSSLRPMSDEPLIPIDY
jgi:hypothetical protein